MNLVDTHNGVSVPSETSKLVTLHNECMPEWLKSQIKHEPKASFQTN
jgi:hypothetical protein